MSISLMTAAWKSSLPSGIKFVLLALCDNANDQGECYPSISMISKKCSISERSVFNHIEALEKCGAVSLEKRNGRSTIYHLDPCKFCTPANSAPLQPLHPTPANSAPQPLQPLHPTPATVAPITISEPSVNLKSTTTPIGELFPGVSEQVVTDFKAMRKTMKAAVTKTAVNGIAREAEKAGMTLEAALTLCCERNWRGFKAEWAMGVQQTRASPQMSHSDASKLSAARAIFGTEIEGNNGNGRIIEASAAFAGSVDRKDFPRIAR